LRLETLTARPSPSAAIVHQLTAPAASNEIKAVADCIFIRRAKVEAGGVDQGVDESASQKTAHGPHKAAHNRTQTAHRSKTPDSTIGSDRHPLLFLTSESRQSAIVSCWASANSAFTGSSR
jgi:hypothetical protein